MKAFIKECGGVTYLHFGCPGCGDPHIIPVTGPKAWGWNGRIEYLPDCTHEFAGQAIDLPEYPEKYKD